MHAIVAVEKKAVLNKAPLKIHHIVFYENPPTFHDYTNLYRELKEDPEFDFTEEDIVLIPATDEMISYLL